MLCYALDRSQFRVETGGLGAEQLIEEGGLDATVDRGGGHADVLRDAIDGGNDPPPDTHPG